RRLDIGWIIQKRQRLLRRIRSCPLSGAFLVTRRVKGQQRWMQKRPLPPGVKPAAILRGAVIRLIRAFGEIQKIPISGRLIRLDALAPDLVNEQSADRQCVVADEFGIEAETSLPRQPIVIW